MFVFSVLVKASPLLPQEILFLLCSLEDHFEQNSWSLHSNIIFCDYFPFKDEWKYGKQFLGVEKTVHNGNFLKVQEQFPQARGRTDYWKLNEINIFNQKQSEVQELALYFRGSEMDGMAPASSSHPLSVAVHWQLLQACIVAYEQPCNVTGCSMLGT